MFKKICFISLVVVVIFDLLNINLGISSNISQTSVVGTLSKSDAYLNYNSFFENTDNSFLIPGLTSNMCPQGLCNANEYILISAYDPYRKYNSCIHVIDLSTGNYLKTIWLKDNKTHVGGITFDGTYVYLANSTESTLSKLKLDTIIKSKNGESITSDTITIKDVENKKVRASFCSYDAKRKVIWAGDYSILNAGYIYGYSINGKTSKLKYSMVIPRFSQGIYFDEKYMYVSTSYGVYFSSKLRKYTYNKTHSKNGVTYYSCSYSPIETTLAPPGSEGIFIYNGYLYILFESAAKFYYKGVDTIGISKYFNPVDRVCIYDI